MLPISAELKPLKTLIVSMTESPRLRLVVRRNMDINTVGYAISYGYSHFVCR